MNYITSLIALLSITLMSSLSARTWTDSKGRSMEAELLKVEDSQAVFLMSSGMRTRFAVTDLSAADQKFIEEFVAEADAVSPNTQESAELKETKLTKWLNTRLVARDGTSVKRFRESKLPQADYIAFYYSASWCPPCKAFTPKLVDFYNKNRGKFENFELVYISSDSNEGAQEKYMVDYEMPWPAVKYGDAKDKIVREYAGSGIPCLVVIDRNGNVIADSYVNGKYVGPTSVMNQLGKMLK
ncbi:thioredoxin-like domain-containing protein [bacterium]|nr:thioredoxin-like domain-containing protein [bacterium]